MNINTNDLNELLKQLGMDGTDVDVDVSSIFQGWLKAKRLERSGLPATSDNEVLTRRQIAYYFGISKPTVGNHLPGIISNKDNTYTIDYSHPWWKNLGIIEGDIRTFWDNNPHAHSNPPTFGSEQDRGRRFWKRKTYENCFDVSKSEMDRLCANPNVRVKITGKKNEPAVLDINKINSQLRVVKAI